MLGRLTIIGSICGPALIIALMLTNSASAYGRCYKPADPGCPILGKFEDRLSYDMCRSQMETYQSEVDDYLRCLKKDAAETLEEYNRSVKRFNCVARGETLCL